MNKKLNKGKSLYKKEIIYNEMYIHTLATNHKQ